MARNVTTEWEDIHVKRGTWKERDHIEPTSEDIFQTQQEMVENYDNFKGMTGKAIEDAIEDDLDLEEDDELNAYRMARIAEM